MNYLVQATHQLLLLGWKNGSHAGNPVLLLNKGQRRILKVVEESSSDEA